jgi:formate dehydrogenase major subunit
MACPGGCICGAGHPVPEQVDTLSKRQRVLVDIDSTSKYRKSQENPDILRLYENFYGHANSPLAHRLLHTSYSPKQGDGVCQDVKNKADSAFKTHDFTICVCDQCAALGSPELFNEIKERIASLKMDSFIDVKSIRLKDDHGGTGVYVTLDGKHIEPEKLRNLYKSVREKEIDAV